MAIVILRIPLRPFCTSVQWSVGNRQLIGLLLAMFFGSFAFGDLALGSFSCRRQIGDLPFKTYLSLPRSSET